MEVNGEMRKFEIDLTFMEQLQFMPNWQKHVLIEQAEKIVQFYCCCCRWLTFYLNQQKKNFEMFQFT